MKKSKLLAFLLVLGLCLTMVACGEPGKATKIKLSDEQITVNGDVVSTNNEDAVFTTTTSEGAAEYSSVHITEPGTYALSGTLSAGQVVVNLGADAKDDPTAVVTLVLKNVDITCDYAPAIVVYNAYEGDEATGVNFYIPNKTVNYLNGSYILDEYEAAVYSNVSLSIDGKAKGELNVNAHTDAGHGIYSEGNITINGGKVNAYGSAYTASAGLYSRKDITINGGSVVSTGHIYDEISPDGQKFAVFSFVESQSSGHVFDVKNQKEKTLYSAYCDNDFTVLSVSDKALKASDLSFWCEDVQFMVAPGLAGGFMGDPSLIIPEGVDPEDLPDFMMIENNTRPDPTKPDFGGRGDVPEFHADEENADIVFNLVEGENLYHVFY